MKVKHETKLGAPDREGVLYWEDLPHILKPFALENMGVVQVIDDRLFLRDARLVFQMLENGQGRLLLKL